MPYFQNKWYNGILYPFGNIYHKCHYFIISFKIFLTIFETLSNTENAPGILREKIWKYESVGGCAAYIGIGGMKIEDEPRH